MAASESPDFLIRFGEQVVGVEVTRLLPPGELGKGTPQAQAALRKRVMREAQTAYTATGSPPLHVSAIFLDHAPLSGGRVAELATGVAKLLVARAAGFSPYCQDAIEPINLTDELSEVAMLHFIRVPSDDFGPWTATSVGWVRSAAESDVLDVLSRKEKKLESYRSSVSEVWLLIVVELFEAGEIVRATIEVERFAVATQFDRVFALYSLRGDVQEISTIRETLRS